jgi:PelA/Pel-15E family pectate lyase
MTRPVFCLLILILSGVASADEPALRGLVVHTIRKAATYYQTQVASHGGYVYHYSLDLKQRWGEGVATADQIWVQPPGTPTVGMAFLRAYEATGDANDLAAAIEAGQALAYGQMKSGGWTNCIDFNPKGERVALYRNGKGQGRNTSSLDDGQTQSAIRMLVQLDETLIRIGDTKHPEIHEAATTSLERLLAAQYPNGAFPQVWDDDVMPDPPAKRASYPEYDWRTEGRVKEYWDMYTLNDNVCGYVTETLIDAYRVYQDKKYLTALRRLGDFLIAAQMPDPQPGWAQQYNYDMQPIWARKFEPPAVSGDETQEVIDTLLTVSRVTGDDKYLTPVPAALEWLKRSRLSDGQLARYYELKTNKPLYMYRDGKSYHLTHDDSRLPGHYGWKWECRVESLETAYFAARKGRQAEPDSVAVAERDIREILNSLDDRGRWISIGEGTALVGAFKPAPGMKYLSSEVFSQNLTTLSRWLNHARK